VAGAPVAAAFGDSGDDGLPSTEDFTATAGPSTISTAVGAAAVEVVAPDGTDGTGAAAADVISPDPPPAAAAPPVATRCSSETSGLGASADDEIVACGVGATAAATAPRSATEAIEAEAVLGVARPTVPAPIEPEVAEGTAGATTADDGTGDGCCR
jgi:hypothetical protein